MVSDYSVAAQQLGAPSGFAGASSGRAPAVYGRPSPYTNVPAGFILPLPRQQQPQPEEDGNHIRSGQRQQPEAVDRHNQKEPGTTSRSD